MISLIFLQNFLYKYIVTSRTNAIFWLPYIPACLFEGLFKKKNLFPIGTVSASRMNPNITRISNILGILIFQSSDIPIDLIVLYFYHDLFFIVEYCFALLLYTF